MVCRNCPGRYYMCLPWIYCVLYLLRFEVYQSGIITYLHNLGVNKVMYVRTDAYRITPCQTFNHGGRINSSCQFSSSAS